MIKILTILHTLPNVKSYRTLCFERILPYLRSKTDVHITWLVYQPERLKIESKIDPHTSILDIHDFKNALEVVKYVKPDIIWTAPVVNLPDYALSIAGKYLNIPVVGDDALPYKDLAIRPAKKDCLPAITPFFICS